jgi:hypothetical protein
MAEYMIFLVRLCLFGQESLGSVDLIRLNLDRLQNIISL